ncbi:hypothetical protein [Nonomuraea zeae]|uniref:hypothetical protein n=1 Tax=Nonomuraea zeae TaxID=1642303 RepID=UPI0014781F9A|nr:hypothetical protein [Nonomuraea zeae]
MSSFTVSRASYVPGRASSRASRVSVIRALRPGASVPRDGSALSQGESVPAWSQAS